MKRIIFAVVMGLGLMVSAQTNTELKKHYEAYYKQMRSQGDMRGAINALTHLEVLDPQQTTRDTLAYLYANAGQYLQAINILGTEKDASASDMALQIKAVSLKSLNQPQLAVQQYDIMFGRKQDVYTAYELADLNLQIGKKVEARTYLDYGIANAKDDQMLPFYESKPAYEVPIKAAFMYQKGLLHYNENKADLDGAIKIIDEAISLAPEFRLAVQIREILLKQKEAAPATEPVKQ